MVWALVAAPRRHGDTKTLLTSTKRQDRAHKNHCWTQYNTMSYECIQMHSKTILGRLPGLGDNIIAVPNINRRDHKFSPGNDHTFITGPHSRTPTISWWSRKKHPGGPHRTYAHVPACFDSWELLNMNHWYRKRRRRPTTKNWKCLFNNPFKMLCQVGNSPNTVVSQKNKRIREPFPVGFLSVF